MKPILCFVILLIGLFSCKQGWTDKERQDFYGGCVKGSLINMDTSKAKAYCGCMLNKIQKRYPSGISITSLRTDTVVSRMAKDCFR